jgi:hypothetical protein
MNPFLVATSLVLGMFLSMMLFMEIGRRIGVAGLAREPDGQPKGIGSSGGAIFGLLGLVIAFTFSGAVGRFEDRRHLITEEANNIGTAWLRIDLLPVEVQPGMRDLFRRYLDARLETYKLLQDETARNLKIAESLSLQEEIWKTTVGNMHKPGAAGSAPMLLPQALNAMIDITTSRVVAARNHPPQVIFMLLPVLMLIGAMLVGFDMAANKQRQWLHMAAFAAVMSLVAYMIIDIEFPRLGLIRIDAADLVLIELRQSMK